MKAGLGPGLRGRPCPPAWLLKGKPGRPPQAPLPLPALPKAPRSLDPVAGDTRLPPGPAPTMAHSRRVTLDLLTLKLPDVPRATVAHWGPKSLLGALGAGAVTLRTPSASRDGAGGPGHTAGETGTRVRQMLAARALSLHMTGRAGPPAQLTCPPAGYTGFETCWVTLGEHLVTGTSQFSPRHPGGHPPVLCPLPASSHSCPGPINPGGLPVPIPPPCYSPCESQPKLPRPEGRRV